MSMKTRTIMLPRATIEEFAEREGLVMEIRERSDQASPTRFYARFDKSEMLEGHFLVGNYGNGSTPEEAIANYASEISGRCLVIGAYTPERREIIVPILEPK